jgi:hypothetical protein
MPKAEGICLVMATGTDSPRELSPGGFKSRKRDAPGSARDFFGFRISAFGFRVSDFCLNLILSAPILADTPE